MSARRSPRLLIGWACLWLAIRLGVVRAAGEDNAQCACKVAGLAVGGRGREVGSELSWDWEFASQRPALHQPIRLYKRIDLAGEYEDLRCRTVEPGTSSFGN